MRKKILDIDPSEVVELEVFRHPVGLVPIYAGGLLTIIVLVALPFVADRFPELVPIGFDSIWLTVVLFCLAILVAIFTEITARIYRSNELVVTNENLIQIIRTSLFHNTVSHLSLEKVQDVSVKQHGILSHIFNFGTIEVETAGEQANFSFKLAKDPQVNAKQINEAHERFLKRYGIDVI